MAGALGSNILNRYRSYTYNFTLAVATADQISSGSIDNLSLVIAKTGGKSTSGLQAQTSLSPVQAANVENPVYDQYDALNNRSLNREALSRNQSLTEGFNRDSSGRFDLFIDNVEISTIMGFTKEASTTIPTTLQFNVFEPYSINGFIEALHVAAISGGYLNYAQANFVLKMEFRGYPDDQPVENSFPEKVEQSERNFVFRFTGIDIDVDEKGTRYKCKGIPFNEIGFGQSNILKKPVQASGSTVKELLEDLMKNITKQILESNKEFKSGTAASKGDTYEIKFSSASGGDEIGKSKILEPTKENTLYKFLDNGEERPDGYTKTPGSKTTPAQQTIIGVPPAVNFINGAALHECIASVIRDSTYLRKKLKEIKSNIDENGMFDYFLISIDVEDQKELDEISRKYFKKYTYIVTPYKIHFTKIPNYESQSYDVNKIKQRSLREYNYIYTGKNIDVINFKLNFNLLYFEAIPYALGNNQRPGSKDLSITPKSDQIKSKAESSQSSQGVIPVPSQQIISYNTLPTDGKSGQILDDPYAALSINLHEAVINSKVNMITGDINIVGDPLYLVTSSKPKDPGLLTSTGEANPTTGEVFITINFNNPVDINPLDRGGLMQFNANKAPFSGVYKVLKAHSFFNEGKFLQRLEIIRIPGQTENLQSESDPSQKLYSQPTNEPSSENSENRSGTINQSPVNSDNSRTVESILGVKPIGSNPLARLITGSN